MKVGIFIKSASVKNDNCRLTRQICNDFEKITQLNDILPQKSETRGIEYMENMQKKKNEFEIKEKINQLSLEKQQQQDIYENNVKNFDEKINNLYKDTNSKLSSLSLDLNIQKNTINKNNIDAKEEVKQLKDQQNNVKKATAASIGAIGSLELMSLLTNKNKTSIKNNREFIDNTKEKNEKDNSKNIEEEEADDKDEEETDDTK